MASPTIAAPRDEDLERDAAVLRGQLFITGIPQTAIHRRLGYAQSYVSRVLNGRRGPRVPVSIARAVAEAIAEKAGER